MFGDADHVFDPGKGAVGSHPRSAIHPLLDTGVECPNLVTGRLAATKVMAGILGDHDGAITSGGVEFLHEFDKILGFGAIEMDGGVVNSAAAAGVEKVSDPGEGRRSAGEGRGNKEVALVLEGLQIAAPKICSVLGADVGLAGFVGFVRTEGERGVTGLDESCKIADLLVIPKHGSALNAVAP